MSDSPADLTRCAEIFAAAHFPAAAAPLWRGERYAHDRIRVAYLSGEFREHATSILMAGVFERHDRDRFELVAFDTAGTTAARCARGCGRVRPTSSTSAAADRDAAALIRARRSTSWST